MGVTRFAACAITPAPETRGSQTLPGSGAVPDAPLPPACCAPALEISSKQAKASGTVAELGLGGMASRGGSRVPVMACWQRKCYSFKGQATTGAASECTDHSMNEESRHAGAEP